MHLLETTIEKITGLLRVGFGEAGAGIISTNLANKDSNTAINPLLPGKTLVCGCVLLLFLSFARACHSSFKPPIDRRKENFLFYFPRSLSLSFSRCAHLRSVWVLRHSPFRRYQPIVGERCIGVCEPRGRNRAQQVRVLMFILNFL